MIQAYESQRRVQLSNSIDVMEKFYAGNSYSFTSKYTIFIESNPDTGFVQLGLRAKYVGFFNLFGLTENWARQMEESSPDAVLSAVDRIFTKEAIEDYIHHAKTENPKQAREKLHAAMHGLANLAYHLKKNEKYSDQVLAIEEKIEFIRKTAQQLGIKITLSNAVPVTSEKEETPAKKPLPINLTLKGSDFLRWMHERLPKRPDISFEKDLNRADQDKQARAEFREKQAKEALTNERVREENRALLEKLIEEYCIELDAKAIAALKLENDTISAALKDALSAESKTILG